ncbi:unnamed protein product [Phytophthora fragariaefolia]|uniref:Unnamed protein product n=1 Tax=Phytophthora fragariaefolia TaxID=1490495 RepID=A0A9W6TW00_9STRA|nr:unnamed protein product [Phytophthora fragariaefolia]
MYSSIRFLVAPARWSRRTVSRTSSSDIFHASCSDSDDSISSELEKLSDEESISSEADSNDEAPNAQDAGNIDGSADDEDKSEPAKHTESNVESGSIEDHLSQAEGSEHATSERMLTVSDISSNSWKRALAEVDDEERLNYVEPIRRYHKN